MPSRYRLIIQPCTVLIIISMLLSACPAPVVEYPVPARRVKDQSTEYQNVQFEGQVTKQTTKELGQRYPAGFYEEKQPIIPLDRQVRVSFRLFISNPNRPNIAKMVTDTFVNVFTRSNLFNIVEREQLGQVASELELNQSGLINQDRAPETGQFAATDVIVTGAIDQAGGRLVDARVIEVTSGRIVLSERITPAAVNRQSAEMLARMLLNRMKEKYYATN